MISLPPFLPPLMLTNTHTVALKYLPVWAGTRHGDCAVRCVNSSLFSSETSCLHEERGFHVVVVVEAAAEKKDK